MNKFNLVIVAALYLILFALGAFIGTYVAFKYVGTAH
jgi:hypothetical protein